MTTTKSEVQSWTLDEVRKVIGWYLQTGNGGALWDLMAVVRGPDTPCERQGMPQDEYQKAYRARRERKYKTGEVIREKLFFGNCGGSARHHSADHVILPAKGQDHYDGHIARAAGIIGLKVEYEEENAKGV